MRSGNVYTKLFIAGQKIKRTSLLRTVLFAGILLFSIPAFSATWYSTGAGNADDLTSWGTNPDGSGAHPGTFATGGDVWNMITGLTSTSTGTWTLGGTLNVGAGATGVMFMPQFGVINIGGDLNVGNDAAFILLNGSGTTINVTGNLAVTSTGYFDNWANNTFIHFNNTGASFGSPQTITWTSSASSFFTDLTVNSSCFLQLSSNVPLPQFAADPSTAVSGMTVNGTLICGTNTLSDPGNNDAFKVNSGGTLYTANTGGINGTSSVNTNTMNSGGNYIYNGSSAQVTGTFLPATISSPGSLTINNSAGVSLSQATSVSTGTLTLTSGRLTLGANSLTLGTSSTLAGSFSSSVMIVENSTGQLRKMYNANGSFLFPIGDNSGNYTPATLNFTSGTYAGGAFAAVKVVAAKQPNNANTANYINRYWTVTTLGITSPVYNIDAVYIAPGDVNGTESLISMGKYSGLPWVKYGSTNTGTHTLTATGVTNTTADFSGITTAAPSVSTSASTAICAGSNTSLTASGTGDPTFTYTWAPGAGLSSTVGTPVTASPTVTTTYTVTATDGNGFTATNTTTVTVNPLPAVIGGTTNVCVSSTTTLTDATTGGTWSSSNTLQATVNSTTGDVTGVAAGTPNITYTLPTGCFRTSPFTVNARPVPTFTAAPGATVCAGSILTYTTQSGQTNYIWTVPGVSGTDYLITGGGTGTGSNSVSLKWLTNGSKTVTVNYTDSHGCTGAADASSTTSVTTGLTPTFTSAPAATTCAGINVTYTTQTGEATYSWTVPGASGTDYTITAGGIGASSNTVTLFWITTGGKTVTVNYTDFSGCSGLSPATNTTTVNAVPVPTFTAAPGANTCAGTSVTYTTQSGQSSYSWSIPGVSATDYNITGGSTSSNTVTLTWLTTGGKTVTANYVDANGCTGASPASNTTTVNARPVPTFTTAPGANTCAGSSVTYTTQSGQSSYSWSIPGVSATDYNITGGSTSSNTVTLNWITTGGKTVTVNYTNASGCTGASPASNTTTVNARPVPTFTAAPGANTCVGSSVTYTTQSGQSSYSWSIPGVSATDYNITAGSTSSNTVTLTWLTTGGKTVTVNYTDGNGCTGASPASNTTTVNARPVPTFTTAPGANTCAGSSVTYTTQSGQSSYSWSIPGVSATDYNITAGSTSSNTVTLNWITTGGKTVTVNYTDANGCTGASPASNTTTVNARPVPTFTTAPGANTCAGSSVTYTTQSGQSSYSWSIPGVSATDYNITAGSTSSNTVTLNWITTGGKTVTVNYTDGNGCTGASPASNTTTVNARPVPTFTAAPGANTCVGSSVTYTTQSGQSSYSWSIPGVSATDYNITAGSTSSNTVTLNWITTGGKTVTVNYTDGNGCTGASPASNTTTVNARPVPTFTTAPGANTCAGSSVTYTTQSGQSSYSWSIPGVSATDYNITGGSTSSNTVTLNWITTGGKTVTVNYTDGNGCTGASPASNTTTVNARPVPTFTAAPGTNTCVGSSVTYTTQSGQSSYSWSIPGVSATDYNITAGSTSSNTVTLNWITTGGKTVTVNYTDGNGCTGASPASNTTTVNARPVPTFTTAPGANSCINGSVTYTTQSGQSSYSWSIPGVSATDYTITAGSTSSNTVTLTWLTTGGKTVTVNYTDANGCTGASPASNTTTVNPLPVPTFTTAPGANACISSGTVYTTQSGKTNYIWTVTGTLGTDYTVAAGGTGTSSNTVTLNWLTTGGKTVTVNYTDANGCTGASAASNTTTVNPRPVPTFDIAPTANSCVNDVLFYITQGSETNYSWTVTGTSGVDYNILAGSFTTGSNSVGLQWLTTGGKTITVNYTDANGCTGVSSASSTTTVHALPVPTFTTAPGSPICSQTNTVYTTQAGNSNYVWSVPGVLGTDYNIISGGISSTDNTVTLQWLTSGSKTVTVNYDNASNCTGASPASNTTTVNLRPVPTFTSSAAANICAGSSVTYTTQSGQTSYVWSVPGVSGTDYSITAGGIGSGSNTVTLTWLTSGGKTVTVNYTNASGCTGVIPASNSTTVHALPVPTFTAAPGASTCLGTSTTYTTQASQTNYVWTVPGVLGTDYNITAGGITSTDNTVTLTWLTTGGKTVTVNYTDAFSCTGASAASNTTTVNPRPVPTFTTAPGSPLCTSTSATYTTQAGQSSYSWSVPGVLGTDYTITSGGISSTDNTVTIQWLTTGSKTVTVNYTDANGCTGVSAASSVITVNARPAPSYITQPTATTCAGTVVTYRVVAGQTNYIWSLPGVSGTDYTITAGGTGTTNFLVSLRWNTSGAKTVTVNYTNAAGCTGLTPATNTTTVNPQPVPTFTTAPGANSCSNSPVTYTTQSGQTSYVWAGFGTAGIDYTISSGGISSTDNTVTLTWITTGGHTVTVNYTDANGCTGASPASNTTTVNTPPTPTFTSAAGATTCAGSSVTYTTQAGQTNYIWSVPGVAGTNYTITSGGIGSTSNTVTLFWMTPGSKTVTVNYTDANGCSGTAAASNTTTVNSRPVPTFTVAPGASTCVNNSVTYTTQAGQSSYVWVVPGTLGTNYNITAGGISGTDNTVTLTWLTSGGKTVTVNYTDANGCTGASPASSSTTVNPLPVPTFTAAPSGTTCVGSSVTYTTQSGQTNYTWVVPGVSGTNYSITAGGIGTGSNTVTLTWLTPGSKTVTVNYTDANGCTGGTPASNTTTVTSRPVPTFTAAPGASSCLNSSVTYTTQSGQSNYLWAVPGVSGTDYSITAGGTTTTDNTVTLTWLTTGGKTVTVNYTDANGCTGVSVASTSTTVNALPVPTFTAAPAAGTCAGSSVTYTTQSGKSNYVWSVPGVSGTDYNITAGGITSTDNTVTLTWVTTGGKTVTVNYTDANGCTGASPASNTTTVNPRPVPTFTTAPGANVCSSTDVVYTTQASQSSYIWTIPGVLGTDYNITAGSTSTNTVTIQWLTTGSKTVTVNYTDANGCTGASAASNTTTVNARPTPSYITQPTATTCAGTVVTYRVVAGQTNYIWSLPGVSGTDYTITAGGTGTTNFLVSLRWNTSGAKTVTVNYTNAAGCTGLTPATNTTTVNPQPVPTFTTAPGANSCSNSPVTYTTQSGQTSYVWAGFGTAGIDYTISSGGISGTDNTVTLTWITTGGHTVTVNYTDANGCTGASPASNTTTVNTPPTPTFTSAAGATTCAGSSVTYTTQAGQTNYVWVVPGVAGTNYTITSGGIGSTSNTVTLFWMTPGSKTVTVNYTDANGCSGSSAASNTTTVNSRPVPTFTVAPGASTCVNSSVTYTTQAGQSSYVWVVPGTLGTNYNITAGGISGTDNTVTLTWLTSGGKTVTVNYTDANGCTGASPASSSTTVNPLPVPTFTAAPSGTTCVGSSVTYTTQSGQTNYTWVVPGVSGTDYSITAGGIGTGSNTVSLTWLTSGGKTVTVNYTDANGCTGASPASNTTTVNSRPVPTFTAAPGSTNCVGGSVTYTTQSGQTNYVWTVPGVSGTDYSITAGGIGSGNNTVTLNWLTTGGKTVTVNYTDVNGCTGATAATTSTTINPVPTAAPSNSGPICATGTATLNANSSNATAWSWTGPSFSSALQNPTVSPAGTATYSLTVSATGSGCSSSTVYTTTVTVNPTPSSTGATVTSSPICVGGTATLNANSTAATAWSWTGSNGFTSTLQNPATSPTVTTTYSLTVSAAGSGCNPATVYTVTLNVNPVPTSTGATVTSSPICNGGSAVLNDNSSNATAWSWTGSNGFTSTLQSPTVSPTVTTTYSLTVSSTGNGCSPSTVYTTTLTVTPAPTAAPTNNSPICAGSTVTLNANGGGGTTTFAWSGPSFTSATTTATATATPSVTATYSLTVTNGTANSGCSASYTTTATVNPLPVVPAITGNTTLSTAITTTLSNTTAGGVWVSTNLPVATVGSANGIVTGVTVGTSTISYTVTSLGCSTTVTTNVTVLSPANALNFDGSNDYISVPVNTNIPVANSNYTIEAWIKPTVSNNGGIAGWGAWGVNNRVNAFRMAGSTTLLSYWWGNDFAVTVPDLVDGRWHHVATTFDGTTRSIYLDGVLMGSAAASGHNVTSAANLAIGVTNNVTEFFQGGLDEVRIWNISRTQSQLQADMNCDVPQQVGLVLNYRFNQGVAGGSNTGYPTAADYSGNANCGILNNFALTGATSNYVTGAIGSCNAANVPLAGPTNSGPICNGGTVTLTANPAGTTTLYSWTNGAGFTSTNQNPTATPTANTTYTVIPSSSTETGCAVTTFVSVNPTPTAAPTNTSPICNGGTATLNAVSSNATAWSWSSSAGFTSTLQNPTTTPTVTTTYSLTVSSGGASGCSPATIYTTIVTVNPTPTAAPTNSGPICVGSTVTVNAVSSNATAWSWTGSDGSTSTLQNPTFTPSVTTTYSLTVSSGGASGCSPSTIYTTTVTVNNYPVVAAITGNTTLSTAITTTLSDATTGGVWASGALGVATVGAGTGVVSGVSAGTATISYTVTTSGCGTTVTTSVLVKTPTTGLNFDGSNDMITLGSILSSSHSYTKEAWVWANATGSNNIISGTDYPFWVMGGRLSASTGGTTIQGPSGFPTGQWVHVAVTYDAPSTTMKLYQNGALVATSTTASGYSASNLLIGAYSVPGNNWNGNIDEARIWDIARSQAQIQANMNCDIPQQANLVAYYRFEDGVAGGTNTGLTTATDYSGHGNCGILSGFTLSGGTSNYVTGAIGTCNSITIPTAAPTNSSPICNGGIVTLTSNGGSGATNYSWSSAAGFSSTATNPTATPTVTTTYSVTPSNIAFGSGCTVTTIATVNPTPLAAPTNNGPICVGGTVTVNAVSTNATIWTWTGSDGSSSTLQNPTFTPTTTTTYSLTVSSGGASGCSPSTVYTTTVSVNPVPTSSGATVVSSPICSGGSATLNANSSNATAWSWTGSDGYTSTLQNPVVSPTATVTYTLTVSSVGNGCSPSTPYPVTLVVNTIPTAAPSNNSPICVTGSATLSANSTGATGWSWSGSDGSTSTLQNPVVSPTVTTTYSLTVTGPGSGCSASLGYTTTVTVNPHPVAAPVSDAPICVGGTVNFTANQSGTVTTYAWTGLAFVTSSSIPNPSATPTVTNTYSLTVTDGSGFPGCSSSYTVAVTVKAVPTAAPTNSGTICSGGTVTLFANPGGSTTNYLWSGTFLSSSIVQNPTATPTVTTTYSLTVSSPGSGCNPSTIYTTTVTVNPIPTAAPTTGGPICNGGTSSLFANGAGSTSTYAWSGPNLSSATVANPTATPTVTTTYTLTVTDGSGLSGCSSSYAVVVTVNPTPVAAPSNSGPICNSGTVTLNANSTSAGAWSWTGPGGFTSTLQNPTATPTTTATYTLTVSSGAASGCSPATTYTTTVTVFATPTAAPTNDGPICVGGTVNLNAHGAGSTTTYFWTGPFVSSVSVPTPTAVPTVTSTYSLTVTNGTSLSGCSSNYTTTVTVNPTPTAAPTNDGPICASGTVTFDAHPGGSTTNYFWSGPNLSSNTAAAPTATLTVSAVYTLTVTNGTSASGCSSTYTNTVIVYLLPVAAPTNSGPICNGGTATLFANPGGSTTGFTWSGPNLSSTTAQNPTATPTVTTTYSLTVNNGPGSGCSPTTIYTTTVTVNPAPLAAPTNDGPICNGGTVNLQGHGSGGTTTYLWSGPSLSSTTTQNTTATPTVNTTYTITVTNGTAASGCSNSFTTFVSVNPVPVSSGPTNDGPICVGGTANLSANTNAATTGWSWSGPAGFTSTVQNPSVSPTVTSTYSLTITGTGSGCTNATVYTTTVSVNAVPVSTGPTNSGPICVGGTVNLTANTNPSTTSWAWSGPNLSSSTVQNPTATPTATATYTVTIHGTGSGCTTPTSYTTTVSVNAVPASTGPTNSGPICVGGTVNLSANTNPSTTSWSWSGPNLSSSTIQNTTATPTVTATYTVTIAGTGSGCTTPTSYTTTVSVNAVPASTGPTNSGPICVGGVVNLSANTNPSTTSWAWSGPNLSSSTVKNPTATPTVTATYSLTIAGTGSGCTNATVYTTTVSVNPIPSSTGATNSGTICAGGTVNLFANSNFSTTGWSWSGPNLSSSTVQNPTATPTVTSTYSLTVVGSGSGCTNPTVYTTTVSVNPVPASTGVTNNGPICLGGTVNLFANTNPSTTSWTWSGPALSSTTAQNPTAIPTVTSTYTLTITGTGPGCTGTPSYTTTVTVNPAVSPITGTFNVCGTNSTTLSDATTGGTWSSSTTSVAVIGSTSGTVTGVSGGTTTISYTVLPGSGCTVTHAFTVNPVSAIGGSALMCVGGSQTLTDLATGGTWSTSVSTVATIGASTGIINALATGNTVITYNLPTGCSATMNVTVNAVPTAIRTVPSGLPFAACVASTLTLGDAGGGTWTSNNTALATVGLSSGIVTGVSAGTLVITYAMPGVGCTATTPFTVNPLPAAIGSSSPFCAGSSITLTDATTGGRWTSGNTAVATIATTTVGTITGAGGGTATITYSLNSGCLVSTIVTVNPLPIAIRNNTPLCPGTSVTLVSTAGGTWTSSSPSVASVGSSSGLLTAGIAPGTTTITYTLPTSCAVTAVATVTSTPSAISGASSVAVGSTTALSDAVVGGTWVSSNPAIASVGSASGIVRGMGAGTVTITYTVACGSVIKPMSVTLHRDSDEPGVVSITPDPTISDIHVIPNPNKGIFTIKGTLGITNDDDVTIEITDMLGQTVYKDKVTVTGGNLDQKVQLDKNIANGMYLLNLHSSANNEVFHIVVEQ